MHSRNQRLCSQNVIKCFKMHTHFRRKIGPNSYDAFDDPHLIAGDNRKYSCMCKASASNTNNVNPFWKMPDFKTGPSPTISLTSKCRLGC